MTESEPNKKDIQCLYLPNAALVKFDLKTGDGIDDICLFKEIDKSAIVADIDEQAALSIFNEFSSKIRAYEGEAILFVWDPEGIMDSDSNFYFCLTEERKAESMAEFESKGLTGENAGLSAEELEKLAAEQAEKEAQEAEEKRIAEAIEKLREEREIKPWKDLGSYEEVKNMCTPQSQRPRLKYRLKANRLEVNKPVTFVDAPITHHEFKVKPKEIPSVILKQIDGGCQTHHPSKTSFTQTPWVTTRNKVCQYENQYAEAGEIKDMLTSVDMRRFLKRVEPRIVKALQLNRNINCFADEFRMFPRLEESDTNVEVDDVVELHTFMDVEITNDKTVTDVQWCPSDDSLVGVSVADAMNFDERVAVSNKPRVTSILLWKLDQVKLRASVVLSVAQEIFCFRFNPDNSKIIAAGLSSGQVAIWDLRDVNLEVCFSDEVEEEDRSVFFPKLISSLDHSQSSPITDLHWIHKDIQMNKENIADHTEQFISAAGQEELFLWDINVVVEKKKKSKKQKTPLTCILRTSISNLPETPFPTKLIILNHNLETLFGTESGTFGLGNLYFQKQIPNTKPANADKLFSTRSHALGLQIIQQSPHFPDLFLTIADWRFMLWKLGCKKPLFISPARGEYVTCGTFCPTRPGVILVGKLDGTLDIWDLTESSHEPILQNKPISIVNLTHMEFQQVRQNDENGDELRLAVGDGSGSLRILKLPICAPRIRNEKEVMEIFYSRELEILSSSNVVAEEEKEFENEENEENKPESIGEQEQLDSFNAAYLEIEKKLRKDLGLPESQV